MSDVSSLRARLAEEEARNRELRGYMYELSTGVSNAYREMSDYEQNVRDTLQASGNRINSSHEYIIQSMEIQAEIDRLYARFKNMELANKKIRECNRKKQYEFANYTSVRKIVQGMLDNLNLNMISDEIIYKSVEKVHLQTPDYWLTAVLLAIMGWRSDDKGLADRAIGAAVKLNLKETAIFLMLFNLRMGREDAALKWFMVYQGCELKGSDQKTFLMLFSMLNRTIEDNVDNKIKYEVIDFINRVIAANVRSEGYNEAAIVDTIERCLTRMKEEVKLQNRLLSKCLSDYGELTDLMACAANNVHILQFILDVGNVTEQNRNSYLEKFINDEIARPNDAELAVYNEIEFNEMVISNKGDMDRTKQMWAALQEKRAKDLNLVSEMVDWIYARTKDEVSSQVRKNMFILTLNLQRKAVDQYTEHYRRRQQDVHPAVLGDYSTQVDFSNRENERARITAWYEKERDQKLSKINYMLAIIGGVLCAAGIGLAIYSAAPSLLAFSGIGAVMILINIISNNMQRKYLQETCLLNIKNKNETMDELFREYGEYIRQLAEYDAYYDQILQALDQI